MKHTMMLVALLLSGCYVYPAEYAELTRACAEHGGVIYHRGTSDGATARCTDGAHVHVSLPLGQRGGATK